MPRFRNTATTSSSLIPPDVTPSVHDTAVFQETGYPTYCSDASSNQTSTADIDTRVSIPTPSPSPNSQSVTLPSPLVIGSSVKSSSSTRKHTSRSSQSPNHIPRPRNAFILFRSYALEHKLVNNTQQNEASREIARIWKNADEETRKVFENKAEEEKRVHKLKYPGYRYAPRKNVMRDVTLDGQEGTSSIGTERESRRMQMRESVRYNPISRSTRTKRTLPTPDTSPEPSSVQISAAPLDPLDTTPFVVDNTNTNSHPIIREEIKTTEAETNVNQFAYSNMFDEIFGSFPSFSLPQPTTATPQIQTQPEFSFPLQEDQSYTINHGYVPCLASSAYYSPIPVHADRRLAQPQHSSQEQTHSQHLGLSSQQSSQQSTDQSTTTPAHAPSSAAFPNDMSGYFEFPEFSAFDNAVDLDELARRALRPSAPLWNQQVNMNEARRQWLACGLDAFEFGHEFSALGTSSGASTSSAASESGLVQQPAQTQCQTMNMNGMNTTSANMNTSTNLDLGTNLDMDMFINTDSFRFSV